MDVQEASKFAELSAEEERQRVEFIRAELQSGFTFADVARTEYSMGDSDGVQQAINNAMKAHRKGTRSKES